MAKALILGDDTRAFLAAVRSLGRQGIAVHVVPGNWASPALSSKYISQTHRLTPLGLDPAAWQADLVELVNRERYDFILPCTDSMVVALHQCRDRLPQSALAMVNVVNFEVLFDKVRTRHLAKVCAVPVAKGRVLRQGDNVDRLIDELGLPLAVKSRNSVFGKSVAKRHSVAICRSRESLLVALNKIETPEDYLVEVMFAGHGVGVSILAQDGKILQAFQHERVNESLFGGAAFYRRSIKLDETLFGHVERISARSSLSGLAMFEFCSNPCSGDTILLEVNARPWGSMPLAIAAGVDFPYLYFRMLAEGSAGERCAYRVPLYGRHVTGDLNSLLDTLTSFGRGVEATRLLSNVAHRLVGMWRLAVGCDAQDVAAQDDPQPAEADWAEYWRNWRERLEPRIDMIHRQMRTLERQRFAAWMKQPRRGSAVLVICLGNICRSPYAEARLRQLLRARCIPLRVIGAGTMPRPGRATPGEGQVAARQLGLDLSEHLSRFVANVDLADVDFVLHFDPVIESEFRKLMGYETPPLFNLAYFLDAEIACTKIDDPVEQPVEAFLTTYRRIDAALENLIGGMMVRGSGREV